MLNLWVRAVYAHGPEIRMLTGPFALALALARVHGDPQAARRRLQASGHHLGAAGLGSISLSAPVIDFQRGLSSQALGGITGLRRFAADQVLVLRSDGQRRSLYGWLADQPPWTQQLVRERGTDLFSAAPFLDPGGGGGCHCGGQGVQPSRRRLCQS